MSAGDPRRRVEIAKIKVGAKALVLDDDAYRDLLQRLTGRTSAAELSAGERAAVLDHMTRAGAFKGYRKSARAHIAKVRALWISLFRMGAVADRSDAALSAFVQRQTGIARVEWLHPDQSAAVIEPLKAIAARHRRRPQAAEGRADG
ncbi:MAG: regulatory protein GemA [Thalassobaculales bacterium]